MLIQRPKPIVNQVADILRERIRRQTYLPGDRLPSESDLAQELGVSRSTVRTVLTKFASERLIIRRQGDGTYVNERVEDVASHYGGIWDFSRLIEANNYKPSIQTISIQERTATSDEAIQLEIIPQSNVISIVRLFCADDRPVIYATNLFPKELFNVDVNRLNGNLPIHEMVQTFYTDQISYVTSDIEATLVEAYLKEILHWNNDQPLLKLKEIFYSQEHKPLILGISFYDHATLRLRLVQSWG